MVVCNNHTLVVAPIASCGKGALRRIKDCGTLVVVRTNSAGGIVNALTVLLAQSGVVVV